MQIFKAADPVRAAQHHLAANTRNPAKSVARDRRPETEFPGRRCVRVRLAALEALPCKTGGAVKQNGIRRQPAEAAAESAEIFHLLVARYAGVSCPEHRRSGVGGAGALGRAQVDFEAGHAEV